VKWLNEAEKGEDEGETRRLEEVYISSSVFAERAASLRPERLNCAQPDVSPYAGADSYIPAIAHGNCHAGPQPDAYAPGCTGSRLGRILRRDSLLGEGVDLSMLRGGC
jgi:hypothetical protein